MFEDIFNASGEIRKMKLPVPATSCRAPKIDTDKHTDLVLKVTPPEALE